MANTKKDERYSYNTIPDLNADWGDDPTNGHKQFAGEVVQEFIKRQVTRLDASDADAAKMNPSVFGGFVNNVSLKPTAVGSDYEKIVFDTTRHMFFAVTLENDVEKYHRLYDKFAVYNDGDFPSAHPYAGKLYVYGSTIYQWNGTQLESSLISREEFDAIFPAVVPASANENETNEP